MLKVFIGCVVSVVVLLSGAYDPRGIPRTYAASASVLITQVQAGGIGAPTQEFIVLYNNSAQTMTLSGWCLKNKSDLVIACFGAPVIGQAMYLPPYKYAVAASLPLAMTLPPGIVTTIYTPTNQNSGSIAGSGDTISLVDQTGAVVDQQTWTTTISAGMQLKRRGQGMPVVYTDSDAASDWSMTPTGSPPRGGTELDMTVVDICPNIEGVQVIIPIGKRLSDIGECVNRTVIQLDITEVLPNAIGSDEGQEFIELYNPNNETIDLANYTLFVGINHENSYEFPLGKSIEPYSYLSFSNSDMPFALLNSSSLVMIALRDGSVISEVPQYTSPKDGESWVTIDGVWQYSAWPTPGAANVLPSRLVPITAAVSVEPQPCTADHYRSLETNRCRLISPLVAAIVACKDGQYRNEVTHRCRNIATEAKTVTPCKENEERNLATNRCRQIVTSSAPASCKQGQERSPDTNRCRTITKMPSADYGVLGTKTKNEGSWYVWAVVGGILLVAVGYAIWEWHTELSKLVAKGRSQFVRLAHFRK